MSRYIDILLKEYGELLKEKGVIDDQIQHVSAEVEKHMLGDDIKEVTSNGMWAGIKSGPRRIGKVSLKDITEITQEYKNRFIRVIPATQKVETLGNIEKELACIGWPNKRQQQLYNALNIKQSKSFVIEAVTIEGADVDE